MIDEIIDEVSAFIRKRRKIIKLILVFLMFMYIDYIQYIPIMLFKITSLSNSSYVILNAFKNIVSMCILFIIYRKELIKEWDLFRSKAFVHLDTGVKYWFLGLLVMMVSNIALNIFFKSGGAENEQLVQQYISYMPWLMFINAGLIAPFCEEMVFRKAFRDAINKEWLFVLLSGLIFGALHVVSHLENWYDFLYIIPYSSLGLALAKMYSETKTIFTSIIMHTLHNSILVASSILIGFIF